MAFGRHWEWRGFGRLGRDVRARIEALPLVFPRPQALVDRYLWIPGCRANLKLREGAFKVKRLLARARDGLEEWLEDERENLAFPVRRARLKEVLASIGVAWPESAEGLEPIRSEDELLALLRAAAGRVEEVEVAKRRWQHRYGGKDGALVELAEISRPEPLISVGLEHPQPEPVRSALGALGLDGVLERMSYLDLIGRWVGRRAGRAGCG